MEAFDYMVEEEGEMMGDFIDEENRAGRGGGEIELNEYDMVTDTSAAQARNGKDIQGIPWESLNIPREKYRLTRLQQYKNYENIPLSGEAVDKECKQMQKGGNYYQFFHNTRLVKPTILHFQLRNLVWSTSKHDVYFMSNYSVMHWSSLSSNLSEILNFAGHVAPNEKYAGSLLEGFTQTQISTLAVKDNFMVAGGFQGELICKKRKDIVPEVQAAGCLSLDVFTPAICLLSADFVLLSAGMAAATQVSSDPPGVGVSITAVKFNDTNYVLWSKGGVGEMILKRLDKQGVSFCTRMTCDDNAITNAVEIYDNLRGGTHFTVSNNDCGVRVYDMERFQLLNHHHFPWPVNHTSVSPNRKLITVVGDHLDGLLVDAQNGKTVASVVGHLDYSFATAWHPDGNIFATGNQDKTCRVWDMRNLSLPMATLKGNLGAVRSIRFSSDGQFMVVAEPADFVHVYSTKADFKERQEIDFFGEISGVSLSPDDESLYIGIWDRTYASLLQYNKRHTYGYLDSYL
ncbi:hypothetical protein JRO89_XS03G0007800 [Xanthoceras sorbifolium]|uniref:Uncharacterized protein n=1 Tax=Xanthoceras sorbifolium TaxID=99658 RepID=A0ABQ8I7Z6_9ROSI|nr:hypothetical protein JRO89_XS03G0007800 [Xanthoceras sorbifolium]